MWEGVPTGGRSRDFGDHIRSMYSSHYTLPHPSRGQWTFRESLGASSPLLLL